MGTAFHLARSGRVLHQDRFVREMTEEEKATFFRIHTGDYARFPGGVNMMDPKEGTVTFGFYHLLPIWLAFGIQFLGLQQFLNVLSLFFVVAMLSLYLLGRMLGGSLLGIALPVTLLVFYPQIYFGRMPLSEGLAQTMFLSGLWIFLGQNSDGTMPASQQRLAAMLFGNMFFARIDALYFVPVALLFVFSLIPALRRNLGEWRTFWVWLILLALTTLYHQFMNDSYLFLYGLSWQKTGRMWTEVALRIARFVLGHPSASMAIFVGICAGVAVTSRFWLPRGRSAGSIRLRAVVGTLLGLGLLLAFFEDKFRWSRFWSHFSRFSPFFPDWLAAILLIGLVLFLYMQERKQMILWAVPVFMSIPAICYIDRPFLLPEQPWLMRRFTPIVFPLFFLLSFGGWLLFLRKMFKKHLWISQIAFIALVICCVSIFWGTSHYLFRQPLYDGVIDQAKAFRDVLPEDALLLLPSTQAGIHFQLPLRYMLNYDTLLLRMQEGVKGKDGKTTRAYLRRQLRRGRPVLVIIQRPIRSTWTNVIWPVNYFLRGFRTRFVTAEDIRFRVVTSSAEDQLVDHTDPIALQFRIFSLELKK